ncbi:glycosyltransferase involved in cell wall biosynthesis [Thermocatellispora tengchongensis]|uniref:Glycosyltransferase involved in cell wall biosynthesis n=1 Tax=Thermocatellispora tengchongensis TaxID=1073253 RepID=A0A840P1Y6_9ACTN|nr:glycosyltransferase [Thermocatellispora tengchongensis]MBB5133372.1 glycosyltransferase involved in cell wall biosynthesis [Thermocatellispora tengchongensis]
MVRVLHVITGLAAGGAEQQLRTLLPHLGARCEVATLTNPGLMAEALAAGGVAVHHLGMRGNRDLRALGRLAALMRRGRYDVVHTHLYRACLYGRLAARLAGVPAIVATEHSIGDDRLEGRAITALVRRAYLAGEALGQMTVAVSPAVAERLARWGVPRHRVEVIPNGIDAGAFAYDPELRWRARTRLGLPVDAPVVGGVGRLEPGKRFDVLIDAMRHLEGAYLLLAGAGGQRAALARQAAECGVARRVIFTGEAADVRPLLCAMDVLAAPSREETFGLAVLEALAAGLPVLYGACPALDDLPADAAPGATRLPGTPGDMTQALRMLLAHGPPPRLAPPPAVLHYDVRRQAELVDALYERLLRRHGGTRKETRCAHA